MDIKLITQEEFDSFKDEIIREIKEVLKNKDTSDNKKWLRSRDVCKLLSISSSTLQNLRNQEKIPFKKINGTIFYRKEDADSLPDIINKKSNYHE